MYCVVIVKRNVMNGLDKEVYGPLDTNAVFKEASSHLRQYLRNKSEFADEEEIVESVDVLLNDGEWEDADGDYFISVVKLQPAKY